MATMQPILLATRNAGKRRELEPLFESAGFTCETLDEANLRESEAAEGALEIHETFAENALAKACYFHALAPDRIVFAEDSGLCVDALGGAPGVRSKRWGGDSLLTGAQLDAANVDRLLRALDGAPDRSAWFECAAALVWTGGMVIASGKSIGRILHERCGSGGFGYDPVFWSLELNECFGAVTRDAKSSVSHRSRAVHDLLNRFAKERAELRVNS